MDFEIQHSLLLAIQELRSLLDCAEETCLEELGYPTLYSPEVELEIFDIAYQELIDQVEGLI